MVDAGVHDVVADRIVNRKDTTDGGTHGAAVAGERIDVLELDAVLLKRGKNGLLAVFELVGSLVEAGELLGRMGDVKTEQSLGAFEHGDLGGGGTRGEGQDLVTHESFLSIWENESTGASGVIENENGGSVTEAGGVTG